MAGATAVVCAAFDGAGDAALERVRQRADALGLAVRRRHRPHLTLGAARVLPGEELDAFVGVAGAIAARHPPFAIEFAKVGTFASGTVWLGPRPSASLATLQRDVSDSLDRAGWLPAFGRLTAPEDWIAHCTIATRVRPERLAEVRTALRAVSEPVTATVDALAVILVGGEGDVARCPLRP